MISDEHGPGGTGGCAVRRWGATLTLAAALLLPIAHARAQSPQLEILQISIDVDFDLNPASPLLARDDELIAIDFNQGQFTSGISAWAPTDVDAADAEHYPARDVLYSFDTRVVLDGGVVAHPGDVVGVAAGDGEQIVYFDHVLAGLPDSVNVDAIAQDSLGLALSFETTTVIHAGHVDQLIVADEDLIRYREYGEVPVMIFDGSAHGVADALDLDAADFLEDGRLLVSFDASGTVPGSDGPIAFDDEDVLGFDFSSGTWSLVWDGSAQYAGIERVDVDAIAFARFPPVCIGDCNSNRFVDRAELMTGVRIALLQEPVGQCSPFDRDRSLTVTVEELLKAVINAQNLCAQL